MDMDVDMTGLETDKRKLWGWQNNNKPGLGAPTFLGGPNSPSRRVLIFVHVARLAMSQA
jgi:hypothetical protein